MDTIRTPPPPTHTHTHTHTPPMCFHIFPRLLLSLVVVDHFPCFGMRQLSDVDLAVHISFFPAIHAKRAGFLVAHQDAGQVSAGRSVRICYRSGPVHDCLTMRSALKSQRRALQAKLQFCIACKPYHTHTHTNTHTHTHTHTKCAFNFITAVYFCIKVCILALCQPGPKCWCFGSEIRGLQSVKGPFSWTQNYFLGLLLVVVTGRLVPAAGFSVSMRQQYVGSLRRLSGILLPYWKKTKTKLRATGHKHRFIDANRKDSLFFNFFSFLPAIAQTCSINCDVIHH